MRLSVAVGLALLTACRPAAPIEDPHWWIFERSLIANGPKPNVMILVDRSAAMGLPINPAAAECPMGCGASSGPCPAACATRLSEVVAGLGSFLDGGATIARMGLAAYPSGTGANTCSAGTPSEILVRVSTSNDVDGELVATASEIRQRLATLSSAGEALTGASLQSFESYTLLQDPERDHFVMLVTGTLPCDSAEATAAVLRLANQRIRTMVVAVGSESESSAGSAALDAMAEAGKFGRICPSGTDAECGSNNTCDVATRFCEKKFFQVSDQAALASALIDATRVIGHSNPCDFRLDDVEPPPSTAFVRVVADGVLVAEDPADGWLFERGTLRLNGALCKQARSSTRWKPFRLKVYIYQF